jgi:hypothetical protein
MWDLEDCGLNEAEQTLRKVQKNYNLSHIYIVSDLEGSYRAWCFSDVDLETLLSILVDSLGIIDYSFFYYTVKRRKATLRTSDKKDRCPQSLVSILSSYPVALPEQMQQVIYDTGLVKRGFAVLIGDRDG